MRGRFLFLLLALVSGCPGEPAGPVESGSLVLERVGADTGTLVSGPARARWCSADSMLTILVMGSPWSGAVSMRTPWPPLRLFSVDSLASGVGIGTVAARPTGDSIGAAIVSRSGTIEVDSGLPLTGRLYFESGMDSTLATIAGRFEGIRPDTTVCSLP